MALYMPFVPWFPNTRRLGNSSVVSEEFNIPGIQDAPLIIVLPVYSRSTIVRNDKSRRSAEESKGVRMTGKPGWHLFIQKPFAIEEPAVGKRHNKHMYIYELACVAVDIMAMIARPVCLPFQTGHMIHREADVVLAAVL